METRSSTPRTPAATFNQSTTRVNRSEDTVKLQHIIDIAARGGSNLQRAATSQLKELYGIGQEERSRRSSRSKTRRNTQTNTPSAETLTALKKLVPVHLLNSDLDIEIPYFLKVCCNYIRKHIFSEGLFRKGGSCARMKNVMLKLNEGAGLDQDILSDMDNVTVFEVCSAMKQCLQRMSETDPLIPVNLQELLINCCSLPAGQKKNGMHLCLLLLPIQNLSVICYLIEFLFEVTQYVDTNKMDARNLAIVMTPNIMPIQQGGSDVKVLLDKHVEVIKELIIIGESLHQITSEFEFGLYDLLKSNYSEDELEDTGTCGKRRKRSSSLNRMFEFLRKKKIMKSSDSLSVRNDVVTPAPVNHTPVIMPSSRKITKTTAITFRDATPIPNLTPAEHGLLIQASASASCRRLKLKSRGGRAEPDMTPRRLHPVNRQNTTISIHPMAISPRAKLSLHNSSKIPLPILNSNSACSLRKHPSSVSVSGETVDVPFRKSPAALSNNNQNSRISPNAQSRPKYSNSFCHRQLKPLIKEIQEFTSRDSEWTVTYPRRESTRITQTFKDLKVQNPLKTSQSVRVGTKKDFSYAQSMGTWPFKRHILKAKRRSDENSKSPNVPKPADSDSYMTLRTPRTSPRVTGVGTNTADSSKSTLRRGRPNTMRAGLSRPSGRNSDVSMDPGGIGVIPYCGSYTDSKNITLDRKGRIIRPASARPGLQAIAKTMEHAQSINFPLPRNTASSNLQLKLKSPSNLKSKSPSASNILPKLRREANSTDIRSTSTKDVVHQASKIPERSISMRENMTWPKGQSVPLEVRKTFKQKSVYLDSCKLPRPVSSYKMNRGTSVQELVKKFDPAKK